KSLYREHGSDGGPEKLPLVAQGPQILRRIVVSRREQMPLNRLVEKRNADDGGAGSQNNRHVVFFQTERRGDHVFGVAQNRFHNGFGHSLRETKNLQT